MAPLTIKDIGKALGKVAEVSEWIAIRRTVRAAWRQLAAGGVTGIGVDESTRVIVFRDTQSGRASATFSIGDDTAADVADKAREAAASAERGAGPPWALPPIAAPARVGVADPAIEQAPETELARAATAIERAVGRDHRLARARVAAEVIDDEVATSTGFFSRFAGTRIELDAAVAAGGLVERVVRRARRRRDLAIAAAIAGARRRLRDRAGAAALPPGRHDLVLVDGAIVAEASGDRAPFSWFSPLVAQADGASARQGLTLYQPGQSVFGERAPIGDPITIGSDGALAWGLYSRPFGELGEPVRRFALVRAGVAAGLALDVKEAALRRENPNGGVRNLIVAGGPTRIAALVRAPAALEVAELAWLDIDTRTGDAIAEIRLAYTRTGEQRRAVTGGVIAGNVFDWLARARLSREMMFRAWYRGPRAIAVPGVDIA